MQKGFVLAVVLAAVPAACAPSVSSPESAASMGAPAAPGPAGAPAAPAAPAAGPPAPAAALEPAAAPAAPSDPALVLATIPRGTAVLHIGDSFALAGFAQALKPRMKALGVRYEVRAETSSFTTTWSSKMERLVADMQPDLVIINLGANEVQNTDPTTHAPAVRHIVAAIGNRPCVWVSPPSWRKDTGITDVIRENSAPCRFFDSDRLVPQAIPRQADHIHPSEHGGAIWAEAFWAWLQEQRAPAAEPAPDKARKSSPWRLKLAPDGEHQSKGR